jgi:hypothetical protein
MSSSDDGRRREALALLKAPIARRGRPPMLIAMSAVSGLWGMAVLSASGISAILALILFFSGNRDTKSLSVLLAFRCAILLLFGFSILAGGVLLFMRQGIGFFLVLFPCYLLVIGSIVGFVVSVCIAIGDWRMKNGLLFADLIILVFVILVTGFLHFAHHDDKVYRWLRR